MTDTIAPLDPAQIRAYHAHVYYEDPASRALAGVLRDRLAEAFPDALLGRWHDQPVGPHVQSMYQVAFPADRMPAILPFRMVNRQGLTILFHPETGNDYDDHVHHAAWLGAVLPLNAHVLRGAPGRAPD